MSIKAISILKGLFAIMMLLAFLITLEPVSYADLAEKNCVDIFMGNNDVVFLIYDDGSVSVHHTLNNEMKQIVESWDNIIQIHARDDAVFGVRKDGHVVWAEISNETAHGFSSVSSWKNITYVTSTQNHVFGLTKAGRIEVAGDYYFGLNEVADFSDWDHIVQIIPGNGEVLFEDESIIGVKENGTLIFKGNISPWVGRLDGIRSVRPALTFGAIAIKNDGSLLFNQSLWETCPDSVNKIVNSPDWRGIVKIGIFNPNLDNNLRFLGLKADGTLVTENLNSPDLLHWNNLKDIQVSYYYGIFGIQKDGKLLHMPSYVDGDVFKTWDGIEKLSIGENIVIGLRTDGTVVYFSETGVQLE